jgi:hypothetical protein
MNRAPGSFEYKTPGFWIHRLPSAGKISRSLDFATKHEKWVRSGG